MSEPNLVMIYLAGVALVAARCGHGPAVATAVVSVVVFDYFFVHPVFGFYPTDAQYFVTLSVMLGIGLLVSELMARIQIQLQSSQEQEQRTAELYHESQARERRAVALDQLSRQLSRMSGPEFLVRTSAQQLRETFGGDVAIFLRESDGSLRLRAGDAVWSEEHSLRAAGQWVAEHQQSAGTGTSQFADCGALLVPMIGTQQARGVLAVRTTDTLRFSDLEELRMLETCANLIALSIERDQSLLDAQQSQVQFQSEQLRNALLSAVSHELRTPLATIAVTAQGVVDAEKDLLGQEEREMLETVVAESHRLSRQVENLLDMARFDAGVLTLQRDWEVLEELVGVTLARLKRELAGRVVRVQIPADFPLLYVADDLIQQVLSNLIENALRYTPPGSPIEISAETSGGEALVRIADSGPGLPPGSEEKLFDKFVRGGAAVADGRRGIGLGLSICRAIVQAHEGRIFAVNRQDGGTEFTIALPCGTPPVNEILPGETLP